jgi:segregation and condensation protein A
VELMRQFDLEVAGEFLVMASTLMYIKSRELLPVDQQVVVEGEEEGEDPRWELIRQLVEYKKFKDAAAQLQGLELRQENVFPRLPCKVEFVDAPPAAQSGVSIFDLLNAVNAVLKRIAAKEAGNREIFEDKWSVSEKIELVLRTIAEQNRVRFSDLFESAANRWEVICTFLALLELIRLKQLVCTQSEPFAEIAIVRASANAHLSVPMAEPPTEEAGRPAPDARQSPEDGVASAADQEPVIGPVTEPVVPTESQAESPVETPAESLAESLTETPTETPAETPAMVAPAPVAPGAALESVPEPTAETAAVVPPPVAPAGAHPDTAPPAGPAEAPAEPTPGEA